MQNLRRLVLVATVIVAACAPQVLVAQETAKDSKLPLATNARASDYLPKPLTIAQQRAKFQADQIILRAEWYNWIGYSPLRPNVNGSYMSNGTPRYYIPSRGVIVSAGQARSWYW